jgi:hypothetical protein
MSTNDPILSILEGEKVSLGVLRRMIEITRRLSMNTEHFTLWAAHNNLNAMSDNLQGILDHIDQLREDITVQQMERDLTIVCRDMTKRPIPLHGKTPRRVEL